MSAGRQALCTRPGGRPAGDDGAEHSLSAGDVGTGPEELIVTVSVAGRARWRLVQAEMIERGKRAGFGAGLIAFLAMLAAGALSAVPPVRACCA